MSSAVPLAVVLGLLLGVSCEEREGAHSATPNEAAPVAPAASAGEDEIIPLRIRSTRTEDRSLPHPTGPRSTIVARPALPESSAVAARIAGLTPGADWTSEQTGTAATAGLDAILRGEDQGVVSAEFQGDDLRPEDLQQSRRGGVLIRRLPQRTPEAPPPVRGPDGLRRAVAELLDVTGSEPAGHKLKAVGVNEGDTGTTVTVRLELRGRDPDRERAGQVNATWETLWDPTDPPTLRSLRVRAHEEVVVEGSQFGFDDLTEAVLGTDPHYHSQVLTGTGTWASRLTRLGDFSLSGHQGLALGDVDGDGREDLFVCDGGSLPNRLYLQQPDGSLRDVSAEAGVNWLEDSRSALLVDLDNDGDQDLVVATIAMIAIAENDGQGRFTLRGGHPGAPYPFSLSAADIDNDGLLDLYACVYSAGDSAASRGFEVASPLPFDDATNGGRNLLLHNLGQFRFADITARCGLDVDNTRWSFAAAWEDYDRDGDADLYVANDFGRNCLYQNDGGRFTQVAARAGVEDRASGMSVSWGDFDRDGHADLYVGNMFSSAGRRVAYQRAFAGNASPEALRQLQGMARGNTLFRGDGAGAFRDESEARGAHPGLWAWSSAFVDLDNDGWQDLAVANGFLTGRRPDDL